jgi:hypothetical protein
MKGKTIAASLIFKIDLMRHYHLILLLLIFSCKKEKTSNTGLAQLIIEGQEKEFIGDFEPHFTICAPDTCLTFSSIVRDKNGNLREVVSISGIPYKLGRHLLRTSMPLEKVSRLKMSYITAIEDGDVFTGGYYNYLDSDSNYVNIRNWKDQDGNAIGEFKANLALSPYWFDFGYAPDTLFEVTGTFKCPVNW